MKKLYLASKNQGKIEEYKKLLLDVNCELLLQPESMEVEENGITFRENAIKKARGAWVDQIRRMPISHKFY